MRLTPEQVTHFSGLLEEERKRLEAELERVGKRNPEVKGDWVPKLPDLNMDVADESDLADMYATLENINALEDNLEESLVMVNRALDKVKEGTYGVCEVCGEAIDAKRLEVYPAATTCTKHSKKGDF